MVARSEVQNILLAGLSEIGQFRPAADDPSCSPGKQNIECTALNLRFC
jgi:hypothetical protein